MRAHFNKCEFGSKYIVSTEIDLYFIHATPPQVYMLLICRSLYNPTFGSEFQHRPAVFITLRAVNRSADSGSHAEKGA
jgi:hypothetical protein